MPRQKCHIVTERKKILTNRADQIGMVATRKIGATDRSGEQHITHDGKSRRGMKENDMPWGVARTMPYFQFELTHRNAITLL
jgi:hypothetical protein